jgi:RNA polymerase sigma-70 factor (ECF subfamily)
MKIAAQAQSMWSNIGSEALGSWQVRPAVSPSRPAGQSALGGPGRAGRIGPGASSRNVVQPTTRRRQDRRASTQGSSASRRTNREWLADLRGSSQEEALAALRETLLNGLRYAFASYNNVREDDLEDFVQESLVRILARLDTFRGESRFTTWAQKIAVRIALTELRRKRWQDVSLNGKADGENGAEVFLALLADPEAGPERQVMQRTLLREVGRTITEELTEKQRLALAAVHVQGMPVGETARRLGTNRNALYKLLHDARQRLKKRMLQHGISAEEILALFEAE